MAVPTADLLKRHRPVPKYDSQESYFADAATIWTDNPGNVLRTADGRMIATAGHGPVARLARRHLWARDVIT